jgi:2'-5' RNA ligase
MGRLLEMAPTIPGVKWSRADQLHLTLLFMGPTPEEKVPSLTQALKELTDRHKAFDLILDGWGAFPTPTKPKVLFGHVGGSTEPLETLVKDVRKSLGAILGLETGDGPFRAHVTLGRVREKKEVEPVAQFLEKEKELFRGDFQVGPLVLFESILGPTGARYVERASFSLLG